jgi:cytoskeletal protein RodZ
VTFIRSNEMAGGGAAVLAVFAAAAILGVAAMSASRPTMRVTFGEFLVAVAGIATVVLIIFAVIQTQAGPPQEEPAAETETTEEGPETTEEGPETTEEGPDTTEEGTDTTEARVSDEAAVPAVRLSL